MIQKLIVGQQYALRKGYGFVFVLTETCNDGIRVSVFVELMADMRSGTSDFFKPDELIIFICRGGNDKKNAVIKTINLDPAASLFLLHAAPHIEQFLGFEVGFFERTIVLQKKNFIRSYGFVSGYEQLGVHKGFFCDLQK